MSQLQSGASTSLRALYNEYLDTHNASLITQAIAKVAEVDNQFNQIMSDTRAKLTSNGYDTTIIDTYTDRYNQMKTDAQKELLGH